jgi:Malectin domain
LSIKIVGTTRYTVGTTRYTVLPFPWYQFHKNVSGRIFDVFVEGVLAIDNLDIFATAPGKNVLYVSTSFPFVTDGSVTIDLERGTKGDPQINGIEVFTNGAPIPLPTAAPITQPMTAPILSVPSNGTFQDIVINCGGKCQILPS